MFEKLPGLPATGPWPEQFSATGMGKHREGVVVRFSPAVGPAWVGNFQRGLTRFDVVVPHPDGRQVVVIAGGQGYVVDPESRGVTDQFGGAISQVHGVSEPPLMIFEHQGIAFEAIGPGGHAWVTPRLSWDGFRNVRIEGCKLLGEACNPVEGTYDPFEIDLVSGITRGGSKTR